MSYQQTDYKFRKFRNKCKMIINHILNYATVQGGWRAKLKQ